MQHNQRSARPSQALPKNTLRGAALRGGVSSLTFVAHVQLGGAAVGGAAGLAGAAAVNNKPGTRGAPGEPSAPLDPGVTRPDSNTRSDTNGQTAAQIAAANPAGNVFVQNTPTAARNPGKLPPKCHGVHGRMRTPTCILRQAMREDHNYFGQMHMPCHLAFCSDPAVMGCTAKVVTAPY